MEAIKVMIEEGIADCRLLIALTQETLRLTEESLHEFELHFIPMNKREQNQSTQIAMLGKQVRELIKEYTPILDEIIDDAKKEVQTKTI
jgi:hypothetical protein